MVTIEFPIPASVRATQRFNGMVNFYRRFVPNLAKIFQPIHDHLREFQSKPVKLDWPEDCNSAFDQVKQSLANASPLNHLSDNTELYLAIDASDVAVNAVLQQRVDGNWQPSGFFSKLDDTQNRYSTFAVYFRYLLEAREFFILTDHKHLTTALLKGGKRSLRQERHLDFCSSSQTTSDT